MRPSIILIVALISAAGATAQDEVSLTKSDRVYDDLPTVSQLVEEDEDGASPDYSREALLSAMWTDPFFDEEVPRAPKTFNPFEFTVFGQTFRFMPFLAATVPSGTSATPFEMVDPFAVAPVSAAYTPKSFKDRLFEWKMKRRLKGK